MIKTTGFFDKDKFHILSLIALILIIVSVACNLPLQRITSSNSVNDNASDDVVTTAIAKTLTARPPQVQADPNSGESGSSGSENKTPTNTPSISLTPTVTNTPTPEQASAYISENTNCREGDKDVYGLIHTFIAGDSVDLIGKNNEDTYWYVKDQTGGFTECWLWKKFATPVGNTIGLPVMYPPPTPTPIVAFSIKNRGTAGNAVTVQIQNTGNITLQSYSATYKDTVTSEIKTQTSNQFGSAPSIPIGKSTNVISPPFSAGPVGHKIKVTIKSCTEDSLSGWCSTSVVQFKAK